MTAPADVRTCYRHPDRVAGIVCQRCDRPICPSCMHQASVGFHCPDCARAGAQKVYQGAASLRAAPIVTPILIGINAVVFVAMWLTRTMEPWSNGGKLLYLRFQDVGGVWADGVLWGAAVPDEPWRLLTGGFLHDNGAFGIAHVGMNMLCLWVFGRMLEPVLGRTAFLTLYITALFGGALGVVLSDPRSLTVGASGAVFGLFGTAIVVARERGLNLMQSGLVTTLALNLVLTFGVPGISIGGHIGGLVVGTIAGLVLVEGAKRMGPRGDTIALAITAGLGVVCAVAAYSLAASEFGPLPTV